MKQIQIHTASLAIVTLFISVAFLVCTLGIEVTSTLALHRESPQQGSVTQVIKDDNLPVASRTDMGAVQSYRARFQLKKVKYAFTFFSFFAILFKVAVISSALSILWLAVGEYQQSVAGKIIGLLHRADGRKRIYSVFQT